MNGRALQADFQTADQATHVILFSSAREGSAQPEPFLDNLDHLQALEQEAKLMLAAAELRRCQQNDDSSVLRTVLEIFPFLPGDATLPQVDATLAALAAENRLRERQSQRQGLALHFCEFCAKHGLAPFERSALLMLLMNFTAPSFATMFSRCRFETGRCRGGMEIGSILSIICGSFRDQMEARCYFSVAGTLMKEEILVLLGHVGETDNILNETVYLHERIARYVVGDNNQYSTAFRYIRREKCSVSLDQVILPGELKEETVSLIDRYLAGRKSGALSELDQFFGYGTALVFLFHGPSGTGKTMLAKAVAARCDRELISLSASDLDKVPMGYDETLSALFREASLQNSIVLLDECDDLFLDNSTASRALLIEIEKARCVVILATNKPVDLDPAMERRITRKISFQLPGPELRLQMWQSLLPTSVSLDPDADLADLAERFHFSGGLIKNAIMMAISLSMPVTGEAVPLITQSLLEQGAALQSEQLADLGGMCQVYSPRRSISSLPILSRQQEEVRNTAIAWKRLREEGLGLNILITSASIQTGVELSETLAAESHLKVRSFDLNRVLSLSEVDRVFHPMTQKKVTPLQFAFSGGPGDASMILFVDYEGDVAAVIEEGPLSTKNVKAVFLKELFGYLRGHLGLCCLVTRRPAQGTPPLEFHLGFDVEYPCAETQMVAWKERLDAQSVTTCGLQELVATFPMHLADIEHYSRQATIQTIIKGGAGKPCLAAVLEVLSRYRQKSSVPLLFGGKP